MIIDQNQGLSHLESALDVDAMLEATAALEFRWNICAITVFEDSVAVGINLRRSIDESLGRFC